MGMTVDFSEFERSFYRLVKDAVPEEAGKALFIAANELLKDARDLPPQAPKDIGDLWGSARTNKAAVATDSIEVLTGFNIEYAARWHELSPAEDSRINWTRDKGSSQPGRKYLEIKMSMLRRKYMEIVAAALRRLLRS